MNDAREQLAKELQRLHFVAGSPSSRTMGAALEVSHTTVACAISGVSRPSWSTLCEIVKYLNGDVEEFRLLWTSTYEQPKPVLRLREPIDRIQAAYIATLEDTVIAAASVIFGGSGTDQPVEYLNEGIYEMAKEIVEKIDRLKGAWIPE